jgi:hypothetical protein
MDRGGQVQGIKTAITNNTRSREARLEVTCEVSTRLTIVARTVSDKHVVTEKLGSIWQTCVAKFILQ